MTIASLSLKYFSPNMTDVTIKRPVSQINEPQTGIAVASGISFSHPVTVSHPRRLTRSSRRPCRSWTKTTPATSSAGSASPFTGRTSTSSTTSTSPALTTPTSPWWPSCQWTGTVSSLPGCRAQIRTTALRLKGQSESRTLNVFTVKCRLHVKTIQSNTKVLDNTSQ